MQLRHKCTGTYHKIYGSYSYETDIDLEDLPVCMNDKFQENACMIRKLILIVNFYNIESGLI